MNSSLLPLLAMTTTVAVAATAAGCSRQASHSGQPTPTSTRPAVPALSPSSAYTPGARHVTLVPTAGHTAAGNLELTQADRGITIKGRITGLTPGSEQGFHIHEKGDCSAPNASSAGGHFNPDAQPHGKPDDETVPHHAGDMFNLRVDAQGVAEVDSQIGGVTLRGSGDRDIVGKAIVVHENADDYQTQPAGGSGARIACGVVQ